MTVLGSGTLVPDAHRSSAAHLIQRPGVMVLLDCGTGTVHGFARLGLPWQDLTHVAISHFHADHVGDLAGLLMALKHGTGGGRTSPLTLLGPPGFGGFLHRLATVFGERLLDPGFPLVVRELQQGVPFEDREADFRLSAHPTPHTAESVAYRWEGPDGVVGYTGDTGPSAEVAGFLGECDVLVSECTLDDPPGLGLHLSPARVADLARVARPDTLVLTHVSPPLTPEDAVRKVRDSGYTGRLLAGHDGLTLEVAGVDPQGE